MDEQIKHYFEIKDAAAITRSRMTPFQQIKELIVFQRTLLQAYCTSYHLSYFIRDTECNNYFLELSTEKFKEVDWNSPEILIHNKFKNHSVKFEDILTFYDRWNMSRDENETSKLESLYHQESMKKFKKFQWTICNAWVDSLFEQQDFVLHFNQATHLKIDRALESLSLHGPDGWEEYGSGFAY